MTSKLPERRCGTCQHLEVPPDVLGRRIPRRIRAYRCMCPIPVVALPDSVTTAHGYSERRPGRFMAPDEGVTCPTWTRAK
jgi:hypothetical protein